MVNVEQPGRDPFEEQVRVALHREAETMEPSGDRGTSPSIRRAPSTVSMRPDGSMTWSRNSFVGVVTVRLSTLTTPFSPTTKP